MSSYDYQGAPFKPGVRVGVRHCAREYCDHVVALTNAICASETPADIAHLITALLDYPLAHYTLDGWLERLPKVPGRYVRFRHDDGDDGDDGYTDEEAPLVATVEDVPPGWNCPDEIPF